MPRHSLSITIGIDARFLGRPLRGIGNYIYHIVRELAQQPEVCVVLFVDKRKNRIPAEAVGHVRVVRVSSCNYGIWEHIFLPYLAMIKKLDILHCPANTCPLFIPRRVRVVVSILDVIFFQQRSASALSFYQRLGAWYRRVILRAAQRRIDNVQTISNYSRSGILRYLGIPDEKIAVNYPGVDMPRSYGRSIDRPGYILALGAEDPRKNIVRLLRAFEMIADETDLVLIIAGMSGAPQRWLESVTGSERFWQRVKFVGFVSTRQLSELYRKAQVFAYVSLSEGFGLPVLEAMSYGCPVVASAITAIPEICGIAALLVDPRSEKEIAEALRVVITDRDYAVELSSRSRAQAMDFTWTVHGQRLLRTYRELLGKSA